MPNTLRNQRNEGRGWRRRLFRRFAWAGEERGSSLVELGLVLMTLLLMLIGVIDFGRAYYLSVEVSNAAYAGALYGSQNNTDTAGMISAATTDAVDVSGLSAVATYGCECSDGSGTSSAKCVSAPTGCNSGTNQVNFVKVTTSATYTLLFPWPTLPRTIALQGSAQLHAGE